MNKLNKSTRGEAELTPLSAFFMVVTAFLLLVGAVGGCFYVRPIYNVYEQRKEGEAQLAHAQSSKEVAVAEAKAKMESATLLADAAISQAKGAAQAEIERAKGAAQANQIIGDSLKGNEDYLRYLWITGLESNNPTVIYVPTEANIPIMEATRLPAIPNKP